MIDSYTRLLEVEAAEGEREAADAAVTRLIAHLKSTGRMKRLPQIFRELEKVAARRHALRPKVEVARVEESAAALRAAAKLGMKAQHAVINPSLIRGWRATSAGELIDHSAKRALISIYQKIIA